MPVINVKMARGRTAEQKQQFVEAVTKACVDILDVNPEWVTVIEYDLENWASGGTLHAIKLGEGFGKMGAK